MLRSRRKMSLTREELREELATYPTRSELADRYPTKDDLRAELAAYSTRDETRAEISVLREETAQGFADMRRYMEILIEDLKTWMKTLFDGTNARLDANNARLDHNNARLDDTNARLDHNNARLAGTNARLDVMNRTLTGKVADHDRRFDKLEGRVTRLESRPPRRRT